MEAFRGLNFYEVVVYGAYYEGSLIMATYRDLEAVKKVYADLKAEFKIRNFSVYSVTLKQVQDGGEEFFPVFVPELSLEFKDLESMAEALLVARLSGLIDVEV